MIKRLVLLLTTCVAMIWSTDVRATHLMGADMTWTIVGPHQYIVSLAVYRDCNSTVVQPTSYHIAWSSATCADTGGFIVSVASGYPYNVTDTCAGEHSTCDGGTVYGVQEWLYTSGVIDLPAGCPDVILAWGSGNRNAVITNLNAPQNDGMYINAELNTGITDNSPEFLNLLTANICLDQLNYVNQGGYDPDHDSLVYALDTAQGYFGAPAGYPYNQPYGLTYTGGFTPTDPITNTYFNFNPTTGEITVFPTNTEYDVVKLVVYEYRNGVLIGHVERDMQIEVASCTDTLPNVTASGGSGSADSVFTIDACTTSCFTLNTSSADTNKILTITVSGESGIPGATFTISSGKDPSLTVCWSPTRADAGTYNFTVTVKDNNCPQPGSNTKGYTIIVPEVYPAGPDQTICQYSTTHAEGTSTTAGTWTAESSNPVTTTLVTPTSPTTLITGFTSSGRYNYIWTSGTCVDTMSVFVTSKPNAGPDDTICQNTIATMAATGTGKWEPLSGNPATTVIADSILATTTISGFTVVGSYGYTWTSNSCSDTAYVQVIAQPNAGPDQSVCLSTGTVTMAGTGTGTWTASTNNPAPTVITSPGSPSTTITGLLTAGTYTFYYADRCIDSVKVTVISQAVAGPDQTICQYSTATMSATGTGTWTALSTNPGTVNIVTPSSPTTLVTGFNTAGIYSIVWSIGTVCNDTVRITVTAKPNAGPDQTICQYFSTAMAATGAGTWTIGTNPATTTFTSMTSPTATVSGFTVPGTYTYYWTENGCSDTVLINVTAKPNAGPDQTICQYSTTAMAATGSGTWTSGTNPAVVTFTNPTSPVSGVSGFTASGVYTFYWVENGCSDTVLINVTAKPDAGPDQTICQYLTTVMAATGTGIWTMAPANPVVTALSNDSSATAIVSGFTSPGTYTYYWTENGCSDTVLINVTAKPSAGQDQSLCAPGTVTTAAVGTGIWTIMAGNPASTALANPDNAVTVISGFSLGGTYSYIWTVNGCADTMSVLVTPVNSAGLDQTTCQYSTVTTGAVGVGAWTILSANPAATTIANINGDTTTISGFTIPGSYGYVWSSSVCTDTMYVTVVAKPNPGPAQTTCQYSTATLSATGAGLWSTLSTNPVTTTIVTPSSATTEVTGFTLAGTYGYIWTVNGCTDTTYVTVVAKPNAGPDQTICQYTSTSLAATGTGTWTAAAGNPALVSFANANLPTTSVSGFTIAGTYTLYWSVNGCSDTVLINVTAKPSAGPAQTTCQYSTAELSATGTGAWTALSTNPAATVIVAPSSSATGITGFTVSGIYGYIWTVDGCTDTAYVTVVAKPSAGPDQTICQYTSATMEATGTGIWTAAAGNPAAVSFVNNTLPTTGVSGFTIAGTYTLYWSLNGCSDTVLINVTARPNAGPAQTTCQYSTATLTATGSGTWTSLSTNPATTVIVTPSSSTTEVTGFTVSGIYSYIWTVNGCTDTAYVTVTSKPNAGSDQTICQYSSTVMAATGTGTWTTGTNPAAVTFTSTASPTAGVSGFTASGTYTFYWSSNGCSDTVLINVTAIPNAGPDQTICQYTSTVMAATGTGIWTTGNNPAAVSFTSTTSPTAGVSGFSASGTYTFYWTSNGCSDTVLINVTAKPDAGPDQSLCTPGTATLYATGDPGAWTALSSNPAATTIVSPSSDTTAVNGFVTGGFYSYIWTINGCTDTAVVIAYPTDPSGPGQTICQYGAIVTAAFGPGTWIPLSTNPIPTLIADTTADTTSITGFNLPGIYGFIWSVSPCTDTMYVTVTAKPDAGPDQTICQYSTTDMAATGTGTWTMGTNPAAVSFISTTSPTSGVSGFTVPGVYTFYWTMNGCSDTVLINVTAKPDAGPDQTICQYSTTDMAATGTGTWTTGTNPATVTFTSTTSPTAGVSGFTASGTYTFYWTLNGCSDTVLINVTAKPDAGPDQTICQYSTTDMAATGTGTWTTGTNPAVVSFSSTTSATSGVSGFTVPGVYTFYWTMSGCSDTVLINVTAKPYAGPDQTICQYSTTDMAATGTGTWTTGTNPAVVTFTNTTSPTSGVSGFTTAGVYTFYWTLNGCSDTVLINVTAKPDAGPDQSLCLPGTITTSASAGPGLWTALASNPAASTIVTPADPVTVISGFTAGGIYSYVWTVNGCADTMSANIVPLTPAGPDQSTCQYSAVTTAAFGDGSWTILSNNPAATVIADPAADTTMISGFTIPGSYGYIWTVNGCSDTMYVTVIPKPDAGPDQTICQYSSTDMAATGTGTWTTGTNPAIVTFVSTTSPTSGVSGFTVPGVYTFYWTMNGCSDTVLINVTAKPDAGPDQTICQYSTTDMAATGTGTWTMGTNPAAVSFISATSPTSGVSGFTVPGVYTFYWTMNGCSDTVLINVTAKPDAGPDQTICQYSTTDMAATGTGTWTTGTNPATVTFTSTTSPTAGVSGFTASGTYTFYWTLNGCSDTVLINVTAKPDAGPDQTICQYSTTDMAATGTGTWTTGTNPAVVSFSSTTSATSGVSGFTVPGVYTFYWTMSGCSDTVLINVTAKPYAGPDQTICQYSTTDMAATGTGTWTTGTNPAVVTFTNTTSPTSGVSGFTTAGVYTFYWTSAGCSDTIVITVTPKPDAGPDQTICQYFTTNMAATGAGTWTTGANPAVVTFSGTTSPTSEVSGFTAPGVYSFYWTENGCSDTVLINVTAKPDAGPDQTICQYSTTDMAATGTGIWTTGTNPAAVTFVSTTSPTTAVSGFTVAGTYTFYWTSAGCSDTVLVTATSKPDAGPDQTICQYTSTAMAATGAGTWTTGTNPAAVTFVSTTSPTTAVSGFTVAGTYTFYWTLNGCSDTVLIDVTPKPNAGPDQSVLCAILPGGTATMSAIGTGAWTALALNPGTAVIVDPTSPVTNISTFSAAGTYSFVWTNNGCSDTAVVIVTQEPIVSLPDTAFCLGGTADLVPVATPAGGTYLWNTTAITPTITVTPSVTTGYSVTYTLGSCAAVASDTVTVHQLPVAAVTTIPSVCTADDGIAIANASSGTPTYTYSWGAPGGTGDTLRNLAPNSYQVTVTDINQCSAVASGTVGLQTPSVMINEVSQHNLRCFDDSTGDIYISVTDTAGGAASYIWTYVWSAPGSGGQNLTHVQAGSYTVTVTDQFGCTGTATYTLTQPSAITSATSVVNPRCFGYADGTATVTPSGGSGGYTYAWNTNPVQTTPQITGLAAGIYKVTITDDSLCQAVFEDTLVNPLPITFGDSIITNPTCYGDSNGSAQVVPLNGIGGYTYSWNDQDSTNPATGLAPGTFNVTVTDASGCSAVTTVTLLPLTQLSISITPSNLKCYEAHDGSAIALASGGTAPYSYLWNNQDTTAAITGLAIGTYTVTARDQNGCIVSDTTTLTQPTQVTEKLTSVRTNCPYSQDGIIEDTASGGTGAFTYALEDTNGTILQTNTTGTFTGLGYGIYEVVASDQNNCPVTDTITVPQAPFDIYTDTAISTSCYGSQYNDGIIYLQGYTIPNGPFEFSIDGGPFQYASGFFGLSAGTHTVTAQDNYGCDTTFTVVIIEPLPATLQILPGDSTIVPGATLQLSTVFGPYTTDSIKSYTWSPGAGLSCIDCPSPLASPYADQTTYTVIVTYNQGCTAEATVQINANGTPPLYIPNAFTPNGDGVNDVWYVFGTGIKDIGIEVFDRWGEKVFESTDQAQGWDGSYRGQMESPGVFVYQVNVVYLNGETDSRKGSLTLIR